MNTQKRKAWEALREAKRMVKVVGRDARREAERMALEAEEAWLRAREAARKAREEYQKAEREAGEAEEAYQLTPKGKAVNAVRNRLRCDFDTALAVVEDVLAAVN